MAAQAREREPAGTPLTEADMTQLAVHCDSPVAAQAELTRLGAVQASLDDAGTVTALWTTAWCRHDKAGRRRAAEAGYRPSPGPEHSLEPAVMIFAHGEAALFGKPIAALAINCEPVRLVCRGDADRMIRSSQADVGTPAFSVGLAAWPVPTVILQRLAAPRPIAAVTEFDSDSTEIPNYEALERAGRQLNGQPLPVDAWCDVCGASLGDSDAGVCARCHALDVFREDATASQVWTAALTRTEPQPERRTPALVGA